MANTVLPAACIRIRESMNRIDEGEENECNMK